MPIVNLKYWLVTGFIIFFSSAFASEKTDSLLRLLDAQIRQRDNFVEKKIERIGALKNQLAATREVERYDLYVKICDEYKKFIYDSATIYARKMQNEAYR